MLIKIRVLFLFALTAVLFCSVVWYGDLPKAGVSTDAVRMKSAKVEELSWT